VEGRPVSGRDGGEAVVDDRVPRHGDLAHHLGAARCRRGIRTRRSRSEKVRTISPSRSSRSNDNHLRHTPDGWRIERLIQCVGWPTGNENALTEARGRVQ
jgi:hypothetical protein